MSWTLVITENARRDIAEASDWYDEKEPGVGREFDLAIDRGFQRILRDPTSFRVRDRKATRLCRPGNWPYAIYFRVGETRCEIIAVVHEARDPKYLNYRLR
jgi:plasmid stabilization system protein ParE